MSPPLPGICIHLYYVTVVFFSNMAINNSNICDCVTQRCASLSSLVIHNNHKTTLGHMAIMGVDRMVCSPMNSKNSIKLSLVTPLNNRQYINILHPKVLGQYFSRNVTEFLA